MNLENLEKLKPNKKLSPSSFLFSPHLEITSELDLHPFSRSLRLLKNRRLLSEEKIKTDRRRRRGRRCIYFLSVSSRFCTIFDQKKMKPLYLLILIGFFVSKCSGCSPDVKFEKDHHRRKELEDKFIHNLADLKNHEEILLKAVEMMKIASEKKEKGVEDDVDYKKRIAEIEKELKATKDDHTRLLEKHEDYLRKFDQPRTWSDTISKYTGDAFGRLLFNGLWGAIVLLLPLLIRPFQRRWLTALRGGDGPTIEEVTEDHLDGMRISQDEVRQILDASEENKAKNRKKAMKAE